MDAQTRRLQRIPSSPALAAGLDRCAEALTQGTERLKAEVATLEALTETDANFARALLGLELARLGDAEARASMAQTAQTLLEFWSDRSGDVLAEIHPTLTSLWAQAAGLLAGFEHRAFVRGLSACWDAKGDADTLKVALTALRPEGNRRVEFAKCLYHLELARLGVAESRAEFAKRAALVQESYLSPEFAQGVVGDDPGLAALWKDLIPYLDEFFEHADAEAERRAAQTEESSVPAVVDDGSTDTRERGALEIKTEPSARAAPMPPTGKTEPHPAVEASVVVEPAAQEVATGQYQVHPVDSTVEDVHLEEVFEEPEAPPEPEVPAEAKAAPSLFDAWLNPPAPRRIAPTEADLDSVDVVEELQPEPQQSSPPRPPVRHRGLPSARGR